MAASTKKPASADRKKIRIFKSKEFSSVARRVGITDIELWQKAADLIKGTGGENLGGDVWKVRLRNNDFRALVFWSNGAWFIYAYLFDKQDEKNVGPKTLKAYKLLATQFKAMSRQSLDAMIANGYLVEICKHG